MTLSIVARPWACELQAAAPAPGGCHDRRGSDESGHLQPRELVRRQGPRPGRELPGGDQLPPRRHPERAARARQHRLDRPRVPGSARRSSPTSPRGSPPVTAAAPPRASAPPNPPSRAASPITGSGPPTPTRSTSTPATSASPVARPTAPPSRSPPPSTCPATPESSPPRAAATECRCSGRPARAANTTTTFTWGCGTCAARRNRQPPRCSLHMSQRSFDVTCRTGFAD